MIALVFFDDNGRWMSVPVNGSDDLVYHGDRWLSIHGDQTYRINMDKVRLVTLAGSVERAQEMVDALA